MFLKLKMALVFFCLVFSMSGCTEFSDIFGVRPETGEPVVVSTARKDERRKQTKAHLDPVSSVESSEGGIAIQKEALRFVWPVEGGVVTSRFGVRHGRPHDGIDISAPKGTPVKASASGKVVYAGRLSGYGNLIVLKHAENFFTAYAHLAQNKVSKGKKIDQGEVIAVVGATGKASGPHCHFEIRQKTEARNPLFFLPESLNVAGKSPVVN